MKHFGFFLLRQVVVRTRNKATSKKSRYAVLLALTVRLSRVIKLFRYDGSLSQEYARVLEWREVDRSGGVTSDQKIEFTGAVTSAKRTCKLRRVGFCDKVTGGHYVFLRDNFKLAKSTIARIYKARRDFELYFKWIKQNLKIKSFYGTSRNAVLSQIRIAIRAYLLIALLKFFSIKKIFQLLQLNLFDKWHLNDLLDQDK